MQVSQEVLLRLIEVSGFDKYDVEQIFWIDSSAWHGWESKKENEGHMETSLLCRSAGYVIAEDEGRVALIQNEAGPAQSAVIHIPKPAIIRRRVLATAAELLEG